MKRGWAKRIWRDCIQLFWLANAKEHLRRAAVSASRAAQADGALSVDRLIDLRERLPNRRPSQTFDSFHLGTQGSNAIQITLGFSNAGKVKEVFCTAAKKGSDLQAIIDDACIAVSLSLQCGIEVSSLADRFGKLCDIEGNTMGPASVVGTIVINAAAREKELRVPE